MMVHCQARLMMSILVWHRCGLIVNGLRVSMVAHGIVVVHWGVLRVGPSVIIARWA